MESMWLWALVKLALMLIEASLITFIITILIYQIYGGYLLLRYPEGPEAMIRWKKTGNVL